MTGRPMIFLRCRSSRCDAGAGAEHPPGCDAVRQRCSVGGDRGQASRLRQRYHGRDRSAPPLRQPARVPRPPEGAEQLFWTNQFTVATTGERAEAATFSALPEHYMAWKDPFPFHDR